MEESKKVPNGHKRARSFAVFEEVERGESRQITELGILRTARRCCRQRPSRMDGGRASSRFSMFYLATGLFSCKCLCMAIMTMAFAARIAGMLKAFVEQHESQKSFSLKSRAPELPEGNFHTF